MKSLKQQQKDFLLVSIFEDNKFIIKRPLSLIPHRHFWGVKISNLIKEAIFTPILTKTDTRHRKVLQFSGALKVETEAKTLFNDL